MKVFKAESKKPSDYHLFLFNDVLLLAKKDGKKYWLRIFCNLSSGNKVEEVKDSSYHIPNVEFRLYSPRKTIIFFAATPDEKQMWIKEIQMAILSNSNRGFPGGDDKPNPDSGLSKSQPAPAIATQHSSPPTSQNQFSQPQYSHPQHHQPQPQPHPHPHQPHPQHHHHQQPQQQHPQQSFPAQQSPAPPTASAPATSNDDDFFGEFVAKRAQSNAPKPMGLQSMGMAGQLLQGNPQTQPTPQGLQSTPTYAQGITTAQPPQVAGFGYPQAGGLGVHAQGYASAPTGNPYASQGYAPSMAGQLMSAHSAAAPQGDAAAKEKDVVFM
eukprot:TRINITY_DN2529_c0_g1_i2.p1 TRINITY_DN2529_c0_g1~~TRINITY_DN2529_c0_g1_i2.p1  ORF type:complete len:325 (-),score=95.14 TRINITY_DN2529_c0_g1_i2:203-1177(-)